MLSINAASFVEAFAHLNRLAGLCEMVDKPKTLIGERGATGIRSHATLLQKSLSGWDVPAALASVGEILALCDKDTTTFGDLLDPLRQVGLRLRAEMKGRKLYFLDKGDIALIGGQLFGPEVEDAFPSAVEDISEAGNCIAFSRYTAGVFHLMRAMECAVQRLSEALEIPDVDREWGKLLSDMEAKIKAMAKGDAKDSWSESHAHLYHVKQAWRNKTMHPKKTYTEEEAEAVWAAVRSFMRHLAKLLPKPATIDAA
jgi:hypothetical protein